MNKVLISENKMRRIISESVDCATGSCGENAVKKLIRYCDFHDFKSEGVKNHRDEIVAWFNGSKPTLELPGVVDAECIYDDGQRGTISKMMLNMWRKCQKPGEITEGKLPHPSQNAVLYVDNGDGTCLAEIVLDSVDSTDYTLYNHETGEVKEHFLPGTATYEDMEKALNELSSLHEGYSPFDPDDDEDYEELTTPEYVIDSIVNGNFNQAADVAFDVVIRNGNLVDLLSKTRETGDSSLEQKVWSAIAKAIEML